MIEYRKYRFKSPYDKSPIFRTRKKHYAIIDINNIVQATTYHILLFRKKSELFKFPGKATIILTF